MPSSVVFPDCSRRTPSGAGVAYRCTARTGPTPRRVRQRPLSSFSAAARSGGSGGGAAPRLYASPGIVSESRASTRWPARASRRASVPATSDFPAPPLPTTARCSRLRLRLERHELAVAAEEDGKRLTRADELFRTPMQLLCPGPRQLVNPPVWPRARGRPRRADESVGLQRPQRTVQAAGVIAGEPERAEALEQVIAVRRLLAQEQQQTRPEEVLRERMLSGHGFAPRDSGRPPPATRDTSSRRRTRRAPDRSGPRTPPQRCACRGRRRAPSAQNRRSSGRGIPPRRTDRGRRRASPLRPRGTGRARRVAVHRRSPRNASSTSPGAPPRAPSARQARPSSAISCASAAI